MAALVSIFIHNGRSSDNLAMPTTWVRCVVLSILAKAYHATRPIMACPEQYLISVLFSKCIQEMAQKNSVNYPKDGQGGTDILFQKGQLRNRGEPYKTLSVKERKEKYSRERLK